MSTPRIYTVEEATELPLDDILNLNREFVNESLVDLIAGYGLPRRFVKAAGIQLWDDKGREYLDFLCSYGALALGHNHPGVIASRRSCSTAAQLLRDISWGAGRGPCLEPRRNITRRSATEFLL
jgi:putrescine aminotransferase